MLNGFNGISSDCGEVELSLAYEGDEECEKAPEGKGFFEFLGEPNTSDVKEVVFACRVFSFCDDFMSNFMNKHGNAYHNNNSKEICKPDSNIEAWIFIIPGKNNAKNEDSCKKM